MYKSVLTNAHSGTKSKGGRGEKQTGGKGTCVYRPLAIARVCTPAFLQKALGYDP